ncbi:LacI family DNA-binding transcriptional regulator [candidate division KSB1 bacterium]|nr:LacI family DNA-binding transcriptional regulator [candidate division KSB1 bacterium]
MTRPSLITLSDLAKELNVSRVTVSKALRDHPDISSATKKRVKALAEERGYSPNLMARSLSSRRSRTIGLVVPKITDYFYPTIIKAIYDALYRSDYQALLAVSYEDPEREIQYIESFLAMRVDGLLVSVTENTHAHSAFDKVKRMGIPLVMFDRILDIPHVSCVRVNDHQAAYRAVEHAIEKGYKRIANLASFATSPVGRDRLQGYLDAMRDHGLPIEPEWVIQGGFSQEHGYEGFMKIYRSSRLPEIIFTAGFSVALGVYKAATEMNVQIPQDIDLIFIGDGEVNPFASQSLSHMVLPVEDMGEKVVDVLLKEISQPGQEPHQIILNAHLKV